jgi:nitrogen PTS system EIIA component
VKRALERAAEVICRAHGLDAAPVFRALWRREQIGSTAIGHGVALPQARISGIAKPLMLYMRPKYAMGFDAPDDRLFTRIWVMLAPADGSAEDHLNLIASIAEACLDEGLRTRLDSAATADDVVRALRDWTKRQVA